MERHELTELHYITPIANVSSILRLDILSHSDNKERAMVNVIMGDMFESKAQTLVNTVNCVGIMGKGVALEFKKRFPDMFEDYVKRCDAKQVRLGRPYLFKRMFPPSGFSTSRPKTIGVQFRVSRTLWKACATSGSITMSGASRRSLCRPSGVVMVSLSGAWLGQPCTDILKHLTFP